VAGFEKLRSRLRSAGVTAPIVMARSTRCRNSIGDAVLTAQQELFRRHADLLPGPDTDALAGDLRDDDCHFSAKGVVAAAAAWAEVLLRLKP
jgi:lysophospholipase L1-like esterase